MEKARSRRRVAVRLLLAVRAAWVVKGADEVLPAQAVTSQGCHVRSSCRIQTIVPAEVDTEELSRRPLPTAVTRDICAVLAVRYLLRLSLRMVSSIPSLRVVI